MNEFLDGIDVEALADSLKLMEQQCSYCHSSDEDGYRPLDEFETNDVSGGAELSPVDNTLWYYVNNRNQSLTAGRFKVNFCPMCGRSLKTTKKRGR